MLCFGQLSPHLRPLFWGDDVVFTEAFVEAVLVLAVKESNPACLLTEVLQNRVILLC